MDYKCDFCKYKTNKVYNLKRHQNNKHLRELFKKKGIENICEKVHSKCEKVHSNCEKVHSKCEKVHLKFICKKM